MRLLQDSLPEEGPGRTFSGDSDEFFDCWSTLPRGHHHEGQEEGPSPSPSPQKADSGEVAETPSVLAAR